MAALFWIMYFAHFTKRYAHAALTNPMAQRLGIIAKVFTGTRVNFLRQESDVVHESSRSIEHLFRMSYISAKARAWSKPKRA